MGFAMTRWRTTDAGVLLAAGAAALVLGLSALPYAAKSAGTSAEVRLPAKSRPSQRTALDLELGFGKGSRGMAVIVRHKPSGQIIGTVTPFGLGANGGVGRFAVTVPQDLETRLRRDNEPLRLELEARDGGSDKVELRSVAPKLVPTAQ
jgi:hypothetical protein